MGLTAMVFVALVPSLVLVGTAITAIVYGGGWTVAFIVLGVAFTVGPPVLQFLLVPPPLLFFFLLFPVLARKRITTLRSRTAAIAAACVLTGGIVGGLIWQDEQRIARLREHYPFASMEGRLPTRKHDDETPPLSEKASRNLDKIEESVKREFGYRSEMLQLLHDHHVRRFVDSPGFGAARMMRPNEWNLKPRNRSREPIEQPKLRERSASETEEDNSKPLAVALLPAEPPLEDLHAGSVAEFAYPDGFGYVKDRRHVAGFQPHQFGLELSAPRSNWSIASVELLGLLLHPQPVVYVSPHLPNMEELRGAPTRPLDGFESAGLEAIRGGEDLFVGATPTGTRMLGAIRNARQCLQCHDGARGDLLGAFSYRLERSSK